MRVPAFKRVDRLVALAVLGAVALTWTVIVSLDAFRTFIIELNSVGQGHYTLSKAAAYVLLTVPRRFYEMFGYAALIGALLGLGGLANSGELTALRAAGLSKLRICASVVLGLGLLTLAVALLGETLGPYGEHKAQALQIAAQAKDVALARGGALWARDGDSVISARHGHAHGSGDRIDAVTITASVFSAPATPTADVAVPLPASGLAGSALLGLLAVTRLARARCRACCRAATPRTASTACPCACHLSICAQLRNKCKQ